MALILNLGLGLSRANNRITPSDIALAEVQAYLTGTNQSL